MITSDQLRERLNAIQNIPALARAAGLPERTVYRTKNGNTKPRLDTAIKLMAALKNLDRQARKADKAEAA